MFSDNKTFESIICLISNLCLLGLLYKKKQGWKYPKLAKLFKILRNTYSENRKGTKLHEWKNGQSIFKSVVQWS